MKVLLTTLLTLGSVVAVVELARMGTPQDEELKNLMNQLSALRLQLALCLGGERAGPTVEHTKEGAMLEGRKGNMQDGGMVDMRKLILLAGIEKLTEAVEECEDTATTEGVTEAAPARREVGDEDDDDDDDDAGDDDAKRDSDDNDDDDEEDDDDDDAKRDSDDNDDDDEEDDNDDDAKRDTDDNDDDDEEDDDDDAKRDTDDNDDDDEEDDDDDYAKRDTDDNDDVHDKEHMACSQ
ncbi:phosphopantothenoylcysteine decarboxylase subunit VHS3-like [Haliotis rufescens]|uniref:phosphopantothenoylcysteine decarboxylase subunit VHS3-like n=1 Tax=Haliotis rufescens TaxID=6454 RepID=UPI00201EBAF5|nr:phosphopantothenoylcysteine decarboxylase subunit VHS3-like [Haliotis rufescens]